MTRLYDSVPDVSEAFRLTEESLMDVTAALAHDRAELRRFITETNALLRRLDARLRARQRQTLETQGLNTRTRALVACELTMPDVA